VRTAPARSAGPSRLAIPLFLVAVAASACQATGPTPSAPTASGAVSTIAPTTAVSPGLPSDVPVSAIPGTSPPGVAVEDPVLIAVLPADVDGQPVVLESQAFADAIADPAFAANVEAAAFGVVVAGDELSSAMVARPVPGAWSEAWFRDWRESYDEGACGQAGGVAGNAEAQLGGRTVFIGTCAGGLRTYHAWLAERGLLVSAFSVGEGRYGEQLMAGLRP
jgi:hypothetical protein